MGWFSKSREELEREQELERQQEERDQHNRELRAAASKTIYQYSDDLKFPTKQVDIVFYNHLFGILLDQQKRIEELERQIKTKD